MLTAYLNQLVCQRISKKDALTLFYAFIIASAVFVPLGLWPSPLPYLLLGSVIALSSFSLNFWSWPSEPVDRSFLLVCVFAALSSLWSLSATHSFIQACSIAGLWRLIAVTYPETSACQAKLWFHLASVGAFYGALITLGTLFERDVFYQSGVAHRLAGLGNPNFMATILLSGAFASIVAVCFYWGRKVSRLVFVGGIHLFMVSLILISGSRTTIGAIGLVYMALVGYALKRIHFRFKALTLLTLSCLGLGLFFMTAHFGWIKIFNDSYLFFNNNGRMELWPYCLASMDTYHHWLLGLGMGQQAHITRHFNTDHYTTAHNIYLELLMNLGLIGLALWINWVYRVLNQAKRRYQQHRTALNVVMGAILVALLCWHGLFESFVLQQQSGLLLMLLLAGRHLVVNKRNTTLALTSE